MRVSLIAAVANNGVIGDGAKLPWHIPSDLKRFRKLTLHKPVIMGRKTFESIGKPLDNRYNIVVSQSMPDNHPGIRVARSFIEAVLYANVYADGIDPQPEAMVIGGASIYEQALSQLWHRCYLTLVHGDYEGDVKFPVHISELGFVHRAEAGPEGEEPATTYLELTPRS